jgi:hypothetical protein
VAKVTVPFPIIEGLEGHPPATVGLISGILTPEAAIWANHAWTSGELVGGTTSKAG